jgi:hypothetical protein
VARPGAQSAHTNILIVDDEVPVAGAPVAHHVCPYNPTADTDPFADLFFAEDVMDPPMLLATARCSVIYATPA